MKKILLLSIFTLSFLLSNGQNVPIDFETSGNGADWTWTTFENGTNPAVEIQQNPSATGINTSSMVAKFTALSGGQPFAGCESLHGADIGTFTITKDNAIIRIMVWKSVMSDVGIKLVRADNWSLGEIKIANKTVNEWEQIEFDFSAHIGNTYDQIVIFPDFKGRSEDNVVYFDNVYGPKAFSSSIEPLSNSAFKIFPNPSNNFITLASAAPIEQVEIYAISGQLKLECVGIGADQNVDVSSLTSGVYVIKAEVNGQIITNRFVKE